MEVSLKVCHWKDCLSGWTSSCDSVTNRKELNFTSFYFTTFCTESVLLHVQRVMKGLMWQLNLTICHSGRHMLRSRIHLWRDLMKDELFQALRPVSSVTCSTDFSNIVTPQVHYIPVYLVPSSFHFHCSTSSSIASLPLSFYTHICRLLIFLVLCFPCCSESPSNHCHWTRYLQQK